jgi:hypothetical protein
MRFLIRPHLDSTSSLKVGMETLNVSIILDSGVYRPYATTLSFAYMERYKCRGDYRRENASEFPICLYLLLREPVSRSSQEEWDQMLYGLELKNHPS